MANGKFLPGSVLRARRGLYFHYGVYVGGGKVVHFSSKKGGELNAATADILITSFKAFAKGDAVSLDTKEEATFPPEVIVQRAISSVGSKRGTYNLVSNNCEHFANWCRCGKLVSHQKEMANAMLDLLLEEFPVGRVVKEVIREVSSIQERKTQRLYEGAR